MYSFVLARWQALFSRVISHIDILRDLTLILCVISHTNSARDPSHTSRLCVISRHSFTWSQKRYCALSHTDILRDLTRDIVRYLTIR
jgi:hypothetical protein